MGFPNHYKVRINGTLGDGGGGVEIFSTGFNVGIYDEGSGGYEDDQEMADVPGYITGVVVPAVRTLFSGSVFSGDIHVTEIECNYIGPDGLYVHPENPISVSSAAFPGGAINGGAAGQHVPFQLALVGTLLTAPARGLGTHGRMFLPLPVASVSSDGRIGTGDQTTYVNKLAAFMTAVKSAPFLSTHRALPVVVSRGARDGFGSYGAGAINPVTHVRVGRVLDTMRSRRNNLVEAYADAVVA